MITKQQIKESSGKQSQRRGGNLGKHMDSSFPANYFFGGRARACNYRNYQVLYLKRYSTINHCVVKLYKLEAADKTRSGPSLCQCLPKGLKIRVQA